MDVVVDGAVDVAAGGVEEAAGEAVESVVTFGVLDVTTNETEEVSELPALIVLFDNQEMLLFPTNEKGNWLIHMLS